MWRIKPRPSTLGRPSESTDVAHGHARTRRIRSTSLRPAVRPGLALAASFLEFPTHLEPRHWRHDARPRARQARSERARARTRRPECSDLDVGRLPGARPGLQRVPWPRAPPRTPGFAAGSVTGRVLAAGSSPRRPGSGQPPEVAAADGRLACCHQGRPRQARLRSRSRKGSGTTVASTRPRRPSTVHSTWSFVPTASCEAGTDARPMACLRIGLQPRLVILPIWVLPRGANTGTGERSTFGEIAGGRSCAEYSPSIPYQSRVTPTSRR